MDLNTMTAPEASVALFDRWRNRPVAPLPVDPTTGQTIPRPRPIIDAIKGAGSSLVGQLFTSLGPMLIPFLTNLLQQKLGGLVTPADAVSAAALEEDRKLVDVLVARLPAKAADALDPASATVWGTLQQFIISMINSLDPKEAISLLISLIHDAYTKATTPAPPAA